MGWKVTAHTTTHMESTTKHAKAYNIAFSEEVRAGDKCGC